MFELTSRFETTDGSRPEASHLEDAVARRHPLVAFTVLSGGDAFEPTAAKPPPGGLERARAFLDEKVALRGNGADPALETRVRGDITRQLLANPTLVHRLLLAKPLEIDVIPAGASLRSFGFPKNVAPNISGLFWDHPSWPAARIALREERLPTEKALVFHEVGHAIHYLAFTKAERELIYRVLRPVFGSRPAMDEVFAIYTEREFLGAAFSDLEKRAPGVYGVCRQQWSDNHLFTRFARKLYLPHKPLAGRTEARRAEAWKKFSGGM